jgi:hypothetical protein
VKKTILLAVVVGALYWLLTVAIAPWSYGPVQFRVAEALKAFTLLGPPVAVGIAVGDFLSAFHSPISGPWERIFMPVTDLLGGWIAWGLYVRQGRRRPWLPMIVYAVTTAASVSVMMYAVGEARLRREIGPMLASEVVLLLLGLPIALRIGRALGLR